MREMLKDGEFLLILYFKWKFVMRFFNWILKNKVIEIKKKIFKIWFVEVFYVI